MISTALVCSLALFSAPNLHAGLGDPLSNDGDPERDGGPERDGVLVRYDLGSILPSFDSDSGWEHHLNRGFEWFQNHEVETFDLREQYENSAPEVAVELIKQILGDELYAEGRMVALEGESSLLVLAPANVQENVRLAIDALAAGFNSSVGLQIDVVELKGALAADTPTSLAVEQVDRYLQGLLSGNGMRHSYQLDLADGRTGVIDQRSHRSLILDYDVEIAKGSMTYDPIAFALEEGEVFLVQAVPFSSGSNLSVVMTHNQMVGDVSRIELNMPAYTGNEESGRMGLIKTNEVIQVAHVQTRSVASSAFLAQGQALVFATQASQGDGDVSRVVVIRQTSPSASGFRRVAFPGGDRELMIVNASVFDSSPLSFELERDSTQRPWWTPGLNAKSSRSGSSFLFDWADRHFSVWRRIGPWLAVVTKPEWDGQAAADLERLYQMAEPAMQQVSVNMEFGRSTGSLAPMRCSLPMLQGTSCGVLLGTSHTRLVDLDVEVASNANVKDPLVVAAFHGLAASLTLSSSTAGQSLRLRGSGHWFDQPVNLFEMGASGGVQLDQSRSRNMNFNHQGVLGTGQTLRLGGRGQVATGNAGLYLELSLN